jgi:hypothetical protein
MELQEWCGVDRLVVVERPRQVAGLVGIVTEDRRDKNRGPYKGKVKIQYSAPIGAKPDGWYSPGALGDGSAHEQAFTAAQGRGELYRLVVEREESKDDTSSDSSSVSRPAPAPAPAAPRRSSRREGGGQLFDALMRRNQVPLPEVRADEQGSRRLGDPETAEVANLAAIAWRIRRKALPAGDISGPQAARRHASASFNLAAPGMVATAQSVGRNIGADATNEDMAEYVASHLEENCLKLDGSGYLGREELVVMQEIVRAAARKPDTETPLVRCNNAKGDCAACARVEAARGTARFGAVERHWSNACRQKIPKPQTDSMRQSHTWERIARDLCAYLRRQILDLDEGSPEEEKWIRDRARVAVKMRSERQAWIGALSDWQRGLAAANRALARGTWTERSKGVIDNCDVPHLAARWELNYFAISDDVPYMHEI